jgi:plastocyanin
MRTTPLAVLFGGTVAAAAAAFPAHRHNPAPAAVGVTLSEWTIRLSEATVPAGQVAFKVTNSGSIPHAMEVEGHGTEQETPLIQPGASARLQLNLEPGTYEIYCPVGEDSHRKLGMQTHLNVVGGADPSSAAAGSSGMMSESGMSDRESTPAPSKWIRVSGGGPVIQILPGPFPFPDSAGPILKAFGPEHEALESQIQNGPYSNNVVPISGRFTFSALDRGATRDTVEGTAKFRTHDGANWRVVLDRVQTMDVPHHPKFGGVIEGLYYHGATGVHTPLVPTINSTVALWSIAHLYRNGKLVSDNAYVHVMLLSHTRGKDFTLECWDCSKNPIDELQLQITPGPGQPKFDAPGGFLFVNWERSRAGSTAK